LDGQEDRYRGYLLQGQIGDSINREQTPKRRSEQILNALKVPLDPGVGALVEMEFSGGSFDGWTVHPLCRLVERVDARVLVRRSGANWRR
jgi:hypothetical protein